MSGGRDSVADLAGAASEQLVGEGAPTSLAAAPPQAETEAERPVIWGPWSRRAATVALTLLVIWLVYVSRAIIGMLAVAAVLAFLMQPAVRRLNRLGLPRGPAVVLSYLGLLALIFLAAAVATPRLLAEATTVSQSVWRLLTTGQGRAVEVLESLRQPVVAGVRLDLSSVIEPAIEAVRGTSWPAQLLPSNERLIGSAQLAIRTMGGLVVGFANVLATVVLTLFFALRMNLDGPDLLAALRRLGGPQSEGEVGWLLDQIRDTWNSFLLGQLRLSLIVGLVVGLGTLVLGVPGALLLGVLAGLLEVLPGIGPILATIPAIIVALTQGSAVLPVSRPVFAVIVALFYVAVQQVENVVLVPRVMGNLLRLPPLVVLVAVVIGVRLGGVVGAFVAAPCVATLKVLAEYTLARARGEDPICGRRSAVSAADWPVNRAAPNSGAGPVSGRQPARTLADSPADSSTHVRAEDQGDPPGGRSEP